jgi:Putative lumazine-binding
MGSDDRCFLRIPALIHTNKNHKTISSLKIKIMKKQILLLLLSFVFTTLKAQTAEDSVKATINQFFQGMKKVDTTLLRSTMTEGVIFQSIARTKEGKMMVRTESVSDFLITISRQAVDALDERITFDVVRVDGNLASVWTPYKFYVNDKFQHCGANSFQLVKIEGVWKIQYIIDTRRKQGCE